MSPGCACTEPSMTVTSNVVAVSARTLNWVPVTRTEPAGDSTMNGRDGSLCTAKNASPEARSTCRVRPVISTWRLVWALRSMRVPSARVSDCRWPTGVATVSSWVWGRASQTVRATAAAAARDPPAVHLTQRERRRVAAGGRKSTASTAARAGSFCSRSAESWQYCESRSRCAGPLASQASRALRSAADSAEPSSRAAQSEACSSAAGLKGGGFGFTGGLPAGRRAVEWCGADQRWRPGPCAGGAGRGRAVFRPC